MTSRVAVVTGASEGIGKQTAIELLGKGMFVVVHGRSESRAQEAAGEIREAAKSKAVDTAVADFSSMKEARAMGEALAKKYPRVAVLLNNAGVFAKKRAVTGDRFELTFAVNHFAHFVLTHAMMKSFGEGSRIVHVSSGVHGSGRVDMDDLQMEHDWSGYDAYASSKAMNVLFSTELARRLQNTHITSNALHPGVIATKLLHSGFGGGGANVDTGARTTVMVCTDPSIANVSGKYFSDAREASASPRARDPKLARAFYEKSCELTSTPPLPEPRTS